MEWGWRLQVILRFENKLNNLTAFTFAKEMQFTACVDSYPRQKEKRMRYTSLFLLWIFRVKEKGLSYTRYKMM